MGSKQTIKARCNFCVCVCVCHLAFCKSQPMSFLQKDHRLLGLEKVRGILYNNFAGKLNLLFQSSKLLKSVKYPTDVFNVLCSQSLCAELNELLLLMVSMQQSMWVISVQLVAFDDFNLGY